MNNRYHYDTTYQPLTEIWGFPAHWVGWGIMIGLLLLFFGAIAWAVWGDRIALWWKNRPSKKRIKSFVIKVKGADMTKQKFQLATDDINKIFAGDKLPAVAGLHRRKKLNARNIISITNVLGVDCRYFVVWYKEGI